MRFCHLTVSTRSILRGVTGALSSQITDPEVQKQLAAVEASQKITTALDANNVEALKQIGQLEDETKNIVAEKEGSLAFKTEKIRGLNGLLRYLYPTQNQEPLEAPIILAHVLGPSLIDYLRLQVLRGALEEDSGLSEHQVRKKKPREGSVLSSEDALSRLSARQIAAKVKEETEGMTQEEVRALIAEKENEVARIKLLVQELKAVEGSEGDIREYLVKETALEDEIGELQRITI